MFTHGRAHLMPSAPVLRLHSLRDSRDRYPNTVQLGPAGSRQTVFVCGFLGCDVRPYNPLLSSLPPQMHLTGIACGWLSQFAQQAVAESRAERIGSETMLTRMAELMFVEVVRRH